MRTASGAQNQKHANFNFPRLFGRQEKTLPGLIRLGRISPDGRDGSVASIFVTLSLRIHCVPSIFVAVSSHILSAICKNGPAQHGPARPDLTWSGPNRPGLVQFGPFGLFWPSSDRPGPARNNTHTYIHTHTHINIKPTHTQPTKPHTHTPTNTQPH